MAGGVSSTEALDCRLGGGGDACYDRGSTFRLKCFVSDGAP